MNAHTAAPTATAAEIATAIHLHSRPAAMLRLACGDFPIVEGDGPDADAEIECPDCKAMTTVIDAFHTAIVG